MSLKRVFSGWTISLALSILLPLSIQAQYCPVTSGAPCTFTTIDGLSISNISNTNNDCDDATTGDGYSDFTNLKIYLTPGQVYQATITIGKSDILDMATIWFDWNLDSAWTPDEMYPFIGNQYAAGPMTAVIAVPPTAEVDKVGRCRVISDFLIPPVDACTNPGNGEIEDYSFIVTDSVPPVSPPPVYCAAVSGNSCQSSTIASFTLANVANDNQLCDKDQTGTDDGYSDYTKDFLVVMNETTPYTVTVTCLNALFSDFFTMWIDWDANGSWSSTEMYPLVGESTGTNMYTAAVVPPPTAVTGKVAGIRVIGSWTIPPTSACGGPIIGEVEDYSFILLPMGQDLPACVDTAKVLPKNNEPQACNKVTLRWPKVEGASYALTLRDAISNTYITQNLAVADTFYTVIAPLNPGGSYVWIAKSMIGDVAGYQCDSATFTTSFNSDPIAAIFPGDSVQVCKNSNLVLNGNPSSGTNPYTTHQWSGAGSAKIVGAKDAQIVTFNGDTAKNYKLYYVVADANGCTAKDSIVVTVNELPKKGILSLQNDTLCPSDTLKLNFSNYEGTASFETYVIGFGWQPQIIDKINTNLFAGTGLTGVEAIRVKLDNGICTNTGDSLHFHLLASPAAPVIVSAADSVCPGGTVTLSTSNYQQNVSWNDPVTTSNDSVVVSDGTHIATYTESTGCKSFASKTIGVYDVPTQPIVGTSATAPYCKGDTLQLSATGSNISWTDGINNYNTTTLNVIESGTYTAFETNARGCSTASDPFGVSFNELPTKPVITATKAAPYCEGDTIRLNSSGPNLSWSVNQSGYAPISVVKVFADGSYQAKVTDANGCSNFSDLKMMVFNVKPLKPGIFSDSPVQCKGDTIELSTDATNPKWSTGATTLSIKVVLNGKYFVKDTTAEGCRTTSDTIKVSFNVIPGKPTVKQQGDSLKATASNVVSYHWFDEDGNELEVTTSQFWRPTAGGKYTVRTENAAGCLSPPSDTVKFSATGIIDLSSVEGFKVYPNPATDFINLDVPAILDHQNLIVEDALGRAMQSLQLHTGENRISLNVAKGMYILRVPGFGTTRIMVQ